ncbi:MAG: hemolysin family protein [Atopostipes sp.]|nr:hemolysin family protein [Atopostipes sp.]
MDPSGSSLLTELLIIIILTLTNAFFAAAEIAFVSINKSKMESLAEDGDKKAIRVLALLDEADNFLATIQVAITLAGFLSSAQAATSFAVVFSDYLPDFAGAMTLATLLVTLILSYFTLVFGELFPKQIAMQMPETIAMSTSWIIKMTQKLLRPFIWLLSASTGFLKRIVPIDFTEREEKFTRDEMRVIIEQGRESGSFDTDELDMMEGVLSLDTKIAREVMVPRTDTFMIDINAEYEENLNLVIDSPYSRVPIYQNEKDNVIGVLHVKNILKKASDKGFDEIDFMKIANLPMQVPSTIYTDDLLIEFQREQQHMAILIDEYGGVEGIVTMEDLLEEIVGEIDDETDVSTLGDIRVIDDFNYYLNGSLPIGEFNSYFDADVEGKEVDTIAGYMINQIGYVPTDEERVSIRINNYVLSTSEINNGRIYGVLLNIDKEGMIEVDYDAVEDIEKTEKVEETEGIEEERHSESLESEENDD